VANRYAIKSGVWSDPTVWDGAVALPTSGDTVRPNTFTVTIDQDITVTELRNDASAPAAALGQFVVSSIPGGGRTITANLNAVGAVATGLVNVTATSGTLTVIGSCSGALSTGATAVTALNITGAGVTVNVTGTITGNSLATTSDSLGVVNVGAASVTLNVTGDVTGGVGTSGGRKPGIGISGSGSGMVVNVTGNVTGGAVSLSAGIFVHSAPPDLVILVDGNVTGGASGSGIYHNSVPVCDYHITGNVTGGSTASGYGLNLLGGTVDVLVEGNVTAGTGPAIGVGNGVTGGITIDGTTTAVTSVHAVTGTVTPSTSAVLVRPRGPAVDSATGYAAIYLPFIVWPALPAKSTMTIRGDAGFPTIGSAVSLTNFEDNGLPDPTDVRVGVTYGEDDTLVGLQEPALTAAQVWDYLLAEMDTPNSIGARLRDAATVATTGAQLAAALDR
jgi:hypothetical protein